MQSLYIPRGLHCRTTFMGKSTQHNETETQDLHRCCSWVTVPSHRIAPTNQPSTYVNTIVKGSFGYLDPDYYATGRLTRKSDVYAFGVVLLEVLCRKRAVDRRLGEDQWNLARWAQESIKHGNLKHIIDLDIRGQISPKCLKEFVRIVEGCLRNNPKRRSTMAEVVVSLESVLTLQVKSNNSLQTADRRVFGRMLNLFPFHSNAENSAQSDSKLSGNTKGNSKSAGNTERDDHNKLLATRELPADCKNRSLKEFKFADLERATSYFSNDQFLGYGATGMVYLGWFDKNMFTPSTRGVGIAVAVKRIDKASDQRQAKWQAKVNMLGQLAHPNILSLLGYCNDKRDEHMLVYEYLQNRNFDRFLYPDHDIAEPLSWGTRLSIMIGAARGLAYLHSTEDVYFGVKSSDILLDQDFNAKLGDFGLARFGLETGKEPVTTQVLLRGQRDPNYYRTGHLTVKSDIYGFGEVLLETLTGLQVVDYKRPQEQWNLVHWASPILAHKEKLLKIIDPRLEQNYPKEGALKWAILASRCVADEPRDRPSSNEVLQSLEQIYAITK